MCKFNTLLLRQIELFCVVLQLTNLKRKITKTIFKNVKVTQYAQLT